MRAVRSGWSIANLVGAAVLHILGAGFLYVAVSALPQGAESTVVGVVALVAGVGLLIGAIAAASLPGWAAAVGPPAASSTPPASHWSSARCCWPCPG